MGHPRVVWATRPELWWKFFEEFVVLSAGTGSFDCVRLSPHFAQDDNLRGISASWDRVRDGWREMRTSGGRLVPGVETSVESHPCAKNAQGWGTRHRDYGVNIIAPSPQSLIFQYAHHSLTGRLAQSRE